MNSTEITTTFLAIVAPSHPNDWEIAETIDILEVLPQDVCSEIFNHIPSIWPISHALCFSFIEYAAQQWQIITLCRFSEWVRQILFHYETGGLRVAQSFMLESERVFVVKNAPDTTLEEITPIIGPYIRGLAGKDISLKEDKDVWTDTETIFLPSRIGFFIEKSENILLYKLLVSYQWALIDLGLFRVLLSNTNKDDDNTRSHVAFLLENSALFSIYCLIKGLRHIEKILPGLWRRSITLLQRHYNFFNNPDDDSSGFLNIILTNICIPASSTTFYTLPEVYHSPQMSETEAKVFIQKYQKASQNLHFSPCIRLLLGVIKLQKVEPVIQDNRKRNKEKFIKNLASFILQKQYRGENRQQNFKQENIEATLLNILQEKVQKTQNPAQIPSPIQLQNEKATIPDDLLKHAQAIALDFGKIPLGYVQAAVGLAGGAYLRNDNTTPPEIPVETQQTTGHIYDEWDCRRLGYRKEWCTVITEQLTPVKTNFIAKTFRKHNGLRKRLRRQFEMMRTDRRINKGQRDGDEIDIDAITDSMCNTLAGKPASTRIFTQTLRNTRNISTFFLVDMSYSTSGWIGTFIKESLILLSEALEQVGDQYGIYGFSGMRRSGCKIYPIKQIDENYTTTVQDRISAITPKDYTRMAPAIRHLTHLHKKSTATTRLIICLSDGKPEDYDNYNGNYAIEDTRKAFLEAQGQGITTFCITVDKQAHTYLARMCGAKNFIFINSIENLPMKVSQLYRTLTK